MEEWKLYEGEYRFMNPIWEDKPVDSTKLCRLALEELGWKKSTCYTVPKKLVERDFTANEQTTTTALMEQQQMRKYENERMVEKNPGGSLPAFLTSSLKDRTLTKEEADEIRETMERAVK